MQRKYTEEELAFFLFHFDSISDQIPEEYPTKFHDPIRLNVITMYSHMIIADQHQRDLFLEIYNPLPDGILNALKMSKRIPVDRLKWFCDSVKREPINKPTLISFDVPDLKDWEITKLINELAVPPLELPLSQPPAPPALDEPASLAETSTSSLLPPEVANIIKGKKVALSGNEPSIITSNFFASTSFFPQATSVVNEEEEEDEEYVPQVRKSKSRKKRRR